MMLDLRVRAEIERRRRTGTWLLPIPAISDAYEFRGANLALLQDTTTPEILLAGPAGTGKTLACLTKVHRLLRDTPGVRVLVVRKTRTSLSETVLQIFEDHVLSSSSVLVRGPQRSHRSFYEYPNGSRLVTGGLDKPTRIMSAEYDLIYIPEATEVEEREFNMLLTRLRAQAVNNTQIIMDANPNAPTHWLKRRCDSGQAALFESTHQDNPVYYHADGTLTERGKKYMERLDALTGTLRERLRNGKWVQAEGTIYDNFASANVTTEADYDPALGAVYWGCDDGYAHGEGPGTVSYHPRVVLLGQVTSMGGLNIFAEYYATGEDHATSIDAVQAFGYPDPDLCYVDQSAKYFRHALNLKAIANIAGNDSATYNVANGIKNLRRLMCDGNEVRLLHIHPRCKQLVTELQSYAYDPRSKQASGGEPVPLKIYDDGPDALRYLARVVWYVRAP